MCSFFFATVTQSTYLLQQNVPHLVIHKAQKFISYCFGDQCARAFQCMVKIGVNFTIMPLPPSSRREEHCAFTLGKHGNIQKEFSVQQCDMQICNSEKMLQLTSADFEPSLHNWRRNYRQDCMWRESTVRKEEKRAKQHLLCSNRKWQNKKMNLQRTLKNLAKDGRKIKTVRSYIMPGNKILKKGGHGL